MIRGLIGTVPPELTIICVLGSFVFIFLGLTGKLKIKAFEMHIESPRGRNVSCAIGFVFFIVGLLIYFFSPTIQVDIEIRKNLNKCEGELRVYKERYGTELVLCKSEAKTVSLDDISITTSIDDYWEHGEKVSFRVVSPNMEQPVIIGPLGRGELKQFRINRNVYSITVLNIQPEKCAGISIRK